MNEIKEIIFNHISSGNTDKAIKYLLQELDDKSEISIISSSYEKWKSNVRKNLLNENESQIQINKINNSIIELVNQQNVKSNENRTEEKTEIKKIGTGNWSQIILAFCAIVTLLFGFYKFWDNSNSDLTNSKITEQNLKAPVVVFTDDKRASIGFSLEFQLIDTLVIPMVKEYGEPERAYNYLISKVKSELISELELYTLEYVRKNRNTIEKDIVKKTWKDQLRAGHKINTLDIDEITQIE